MDDYSSTLHRCMDLRLCRCRSFRLPKSDAIRRWPSLDLVGGRNLRKRTYSLGNENAARASREWPSRDRRPEYHYFRLRHLYLIMGRPMLGGNEFAGLESARQSMPILIGPTR